MNTPKSVNKTLVIGLGGTGKLILTALKKNLIEAGYRLDDIASGIKLYNLDFDPAPVYVKSRSNVNGDTVSLSPSEYQYLNSDNIQRRIGNLLDENNQAYFENWYPDKANEFIRMGNHRAGAAQWRPLGRVGFFEYADRIYRELETQLNTLMSAPSHTQMDETNKDVIVYIISSTAGGSGAGIFLDVAYALRSMETVPPLKQIGYFILPAIYSKHDVHGRTQANTYASLKELTALASPDHYFAAQYSNNRVIDQTTLTGNPFDMMFLFDDLIGPNRVAENPSQLAEIAAHSIFQSLANSSISNSYESMMANQSKAPDAIAEKCVFSTIGGLDLHFPAMESIKKYWILKDIQTHLLPAYGKQFKLKQSLNLSSMDTYGPATDSQPDLAHIEQISTLLETTIKNCREYFPKPYIEFAAQELGKTLSQKKEDFNSLWSQVETILETLKAPDLPHGDLPIPPINFPDNLPEGKQDDELGNGALRKAMGQLQDLLNQCAPISSSQAETTRIKKGLNRLVETWEKQADTITSNMDEYFNSQSTRFSELKEDLKLLLKSPPWNIDNAPEKALIQWCRGLWNCIDQAYYKFAHQARPLSLFTTMVKRHIKDSLNIAVQEEAHTLQAQLTHTEEVTGSIPEQIRQLIARETRTDCLVHRSLGTLAFFEKSWVQFQKAGKGILKESPTQPSTSKGAKGAKEMEQDLWEVSLDRISRVLNSPKGQKLNELFNYIDVDAVMREMTRAKNDYFITNNQSNKNARKMVIIHSPSFTTDSDSDLNGTTYNQLKGIVKNAFNGAETEFISYPHSNNDGSRAQISLRYVHLNIPSYNLKNISQYYAAYMGYGSGRKNFHASFDFTGFPEIVVESQVKTYPTCGNPNCSYDLSQVTRNELYCPGCGKPIKNRCGNPECQEDLLSLRPEMKGDNPNKLCPSCGKPARTYWWECDRHNQLYRRESVFCIQCLEDHQQERISMNEVRRAMPIEIHFNCPGCIELNQNSNTYREPYKIKFEDVFDEVRDAKVERAFEIYYSKETGGGQCPKCNAQLLPLCPHEGFDSETPHFVKRGPGRINLKAPKNGSDPRTKGFFFCTTKQDHAEKKIMECSHCGMPLKVEADYCPRCNRNNKTSSPYNLDEQINDKDERQKIDFFMEDNRMIYFGLPDSDRISRNQAQRFYNEDRVSFKQVEKIVSKDMETGVQPYPTTPTSDSDLEDLMTGFKEGKRGDK